MRRRLPVAIAACLALSAVMSPGVSVAQGGEPLVAAVTLAPMGEGTVTGLAVLSPRDGDTAANVVAVGAPAGTMAVVHVGSCAGIDPTPVGLLGDVGTTGQLAATVPLAFDAITDGAHVIALHPGLDLSTTLACGVIPRIDARSDGRSTPGPDVTTPPTGERFESATFGFVLDWADPWQRRDWDPGEGYEGLSLTNGTSSVSVVAFPIDGGDASACIRDWEGRLLGLLRAGTVADLQPVSDGDGQSDGAGDAERAVGMYQYRYTTKDDPKGSTIVERDECRRLSDSSVVEITADVPVDARDTQTPLVEALVARLVLTGAPSNPTDAPTNPTDAPTTTAPSTPVPTAAPTPEPTVDAACQGMDAWVSDTLARFTALKGIADDVGAAMNAGMGAYAEALAQASVSVQRIQVEQQRVSVPATAKDVQADIIKTLQKLAESYDLMSQAYATSNTGLLQQGLSAGSEAQAGATAALAALRRVATPCGIVVPAA